MEFYLLIASIILLVVLMMITVFKKSGKQDFNDIKNELVTIFKEELKETRRENREMNKENRQEINSLFKDLQDSLMKRLSENISIQKDQLETFSRLLVEMSDKQLKSYNDFKESIKTDAKENRGELNKGLKSFEDKFADNIKGFNEQLRQRFDELSKQQFEFNKQSKDSIKDIKETIEKQLVSIREDNTIQLNEMRKTVDENYKQLLKKTW